MEAFIHHVEAAYLFSNISVIFFNLLFLSWFHARSVVGYSRTTVWIVVLSLWLLAARANLLTSPLLPPLAA